MSTHAAIRYEADNGTNPGVYLHFDGYPENVAHQMKAMSYIQVKEGIERALVKGGIRSIVNNDFSDTFNENRSRAESMISEDNLLEFNYVKRLDGSVECVDSRGHRIF